MADKTTRKLIAEPEFDDLVNQFNKLRDDLKLRSVLANHVHEDNNVAAVATADATDLPTSVALANALKATYNTHRAKDRRARRGRRDEPDHDSGRDGPHHLRRAR
jgi:hypothetical protein